MNTQEQNTLENAVAADLARSGLTLADLGGKIVSPAAIQQAVGMQHRPHCAGGYAIPYLNLDGKPILFAGQPFKRIRVVQPAPNAELPKYVSPPSSGTHIYVPAQLKHALELSPGTLVITEGEKKAVAACKAGIPAVAAAGVWMFRDDDPTLSDDARANTLNPELRQTIECLVTDGTVEKIVVLFDSDGEAYKKGQVHEDDDHSYTENRSKALVRNPKVRSAAYALARSLKQHVFEIPVGVAFCQPEFDAQRTRKRYDLPTIAGHRGLDDMLKAGDKNQLVGLIRTAAARAKPGVRPAYYPLGVSPDGKSITVWSTALDTRVTLSTASMSQSSTLVVNFGLPWLEQHFPPDEERASGSFSPRAASDAITQSCVEKGIYHADDERGFGVWREGGRLLVNTRQGVFDAATGSAVARLEKGRKTIYLPDGRNSPPGYKKVSDDRGQELVERVVKTLNTWNWAHRSSPVLMLGWLVQSLYVGAVDVRPHVWVVAPRGSGKTTLLSFLNSILRGYAAYAASAAESSAAGIRQFIGTSAIPLLIDEAERSGSETSSGHVGHILRVLRAAYSSEGAAIKGTADGRGTVFSLRATGCVASISDPGLEPADRTRTAVLTLKTHAGAGQKPEPFGEADAADLLWYLLRRFDRFCQARTQAVEAIGKLGGDARERETYGTLLAGAAAALDEPLDSGQIEAITGLLEQDHLSAARQESDDSTQALEAILSAVAEMEVPTDNGGTARTKKSVGELVLGEFDHSGGATQAALGRVGMRVVTARDGAKHLAVAYRHNGLSKLLNGTRFADGWSSQLLNLPNAVAKTARIASVAIKAVYIPKDVVMSLLSGDS